MSSTDMSVLDVRWAGRDTFKAEEVAEILGLSVWSVYDAAKKKEIPAVSIGRRLVFPRVGLEKLLRVA
jgi:excisionase family DNA binding protein